MTKGQIAAVMAQHPTLCYCGMGLDITGFRRTADERAALLARERERLLDAEEECTRAEGWLSAVQRTKTANRRHDSYGLKGFAEEAAGGEYVSNGAFVAAAVHLGIPYEIIDGSPNVLFGISERSVRPHARV